nr:tRNA-dihydrouridine synthase [Sansalvadorimonas sp. 2012CJ34-2]
MEGVVDYLMRQLLTDTGGFDLCVTEFIRITNTLYPNSVFYRLCPELHDGCKTRSGTPVHMQLMGNDPTLMAENACKAARLGALGIDLNFGCPAKTVNNHKGGAALLKEPEAVYTIVSAVRSQVPDHIPVTAKMRLGYDSCEHALDIALGIEAAGADSLAIHARTRKEGYRPPAHWEILARIREQLRIRLTANGEIWTAEDYYRCRAVSGCSDIMIGRGAIARPLLAANIKASMRGSEQNFQEDSWPETRAVVLNFAEKILSSPGGRDHPYGVEHPEKYLADRLKQWLRMMTKGHSEAAELFNNVKQHKCAKAILSELKAA